MTLMLGDCREVLKTLADASVDSVVTDPPYELGFMGKAWDGTGVAYDVALWRQVLRVLKPGGHLLAFGGSRTYHRLACAVEDAGFEIRDQIMWVYGSGFPKSLDVSKAIDKAAGEVRTETEWYDRYKDGGTRQKQDVANQNIALADGRNGNERSLPATTSARQWQGWGTALKPAHEPIVVARKPLIGTVAENVLAFGTGAINVDGCRVGTEQITIHGYTGCSYSHSYKEAGTRPVLDQYRTAMGRWPANLIHDGSAEVVGRFPDSEGRPAKAIIAGGTSGSGIGTRNGIYQDGHGGIASVGYLDTGSAARFFYTAKADATDRDQGLEGFGAVAPVVALAGRPENKGQTGNPYTTTSPMPKRNHHPTVKPTELMRYLCRLVTPPGGIVLDPFMGSGSTGKAAALERFDFIGIELDPDYLEIARARIAWLGVAPAVQGMTPREVQPPTGAQLALAFA